MEWRGWLRDQPGVESVVAVFCVVLVLGLAVGAAVAVGPASASGDSLDDVGESEDDEINGTEDAEAGEDTINETEDAEATDEAGEDTINETEDVEDTDEAGEDSINETEEVPATNDTEADDANEEDSVTNEPDDEDSASNSTDETETDADEVSDNETMDAKVEGDSTVSNATKTAESGEESEKAINTVDDADDVSDDAQDDATTDDTIDDVDAGADEVADAADDIDDEEAIDESGNISTSGNATNIDIGSEEIVNDEDGVNLSDKSEAVKETLEDATPENGSIETVTADASPDDAEIVDEGIDQANGLIGFEDHNTSGDTVADPITEQGSDVDDSEEEIVHRGQQVAAAAEKTIPGEVASGDLSDQDGTLVDANLSAEDSLLAAGESSLSLATRDSLTESNPMDQVSSLTRDDPTEAAIDETPDRWVTGAASLHSVEEATNGVHYSQLHAADASTNTVEGSHAVPRVRGTAGGDGGAPSSDGTAGTLTPVIGPPRLREGSIAIVVGGGSLALGVVGYAAGTKAGSLANVPLIRRVMSLLRALVARIGLPGFPVLPGYSRHDDSDPLVHEVRSSIHERATSHPGVHLSELAGDLAVSRSTIRYHVRVLERERLIESANIRGCRRVFPIETGADALAAIESDTTAHELLVALSERDSARVSELADQLDLDASTISYHLSRLEQEGLVVRDDDGSAVVNRLSQRAAAAVGPTTRTRSGVDPVSSD